MGDSLVKLLRCRYSAGTCIRHQAESGAFYATLVNGKEDTKRWIGVLEVPRHRRHRPSGICLYLRPQIRLWVHQLTSWVFREAGHSQRV